MKNRISQDQPRMEQADERIGVAIVCNSAPPYRVHLHQKLATHLTEIRLWTLRTHAEDKRWSLQTPQEIGLVSLDVGVPCQEQGQRRHAAREWAVGGRVIQWIKRHGIRFVILMGYNDAGRLRIIRWCRRHGVPCFVAGDSNIRDDQAAGVKAIVKKLVLGRLFRWISGAMPVGSLGEAYFAKYGVPPERQFLLALEPDYQLIRMLSPERVREVREKFGLSECRRRMLFSGRLVPVKRVDQLIDAFAAVAVDRPEWDLVILGDGELRNELEQRVPPELRTRVIWTGHIADQALVSAFYRACDVLALPSTREPWALVINEAAAAGMALVSSSVPGASAELVRDGVNGRIYPAGSLCDLIDALQDVTRPDRLEAMKAASPGVLEDWLRRSDPIESLRRAMRFAGVLPARGRAEASTSIAGGVAAG